MTVQYSFPKAASFGRMISKSKIYENATPTPRVRRLFVTQVEKIIWSYKLSPETINLPASDGVQEIQVFTISLRTCELSFEVLQVIDKAIPSPILFVLNYSGKYRYVATYKRPSEAGKNKVVVSSYFRSGWVSDDTEKIELPIVLNMGELYQSLLMSLSPLSFRKGESLDSLVSRVDQLRVKEREAVKLKSRIERKKQFNRRVELNGMLNEVKQEIKDLKY